MIRSAPEISSSVHGELPLVAQTAEVLWGVPSGVAHHRNDKSGRRKTPWWVWCNLLSLDAPAVALVWALLFAHCYGSTVSSAETSILALVVWAIYISDRLLDGWKVKQLSFLQERHVFCIRHRFPLCGLTILAVLGSVCLARRFLTEREILVGLPLAVLVVLYMFAVHAGPVWLQRHLPKELAVGFLFAAGTAFPLWSAHNVGVSQIWLPLVFFAALCSLNCLAIECWESAWAKNPTRRMPVLVRWGNLRITAIAAIMGIAAVSSIFLSTRRAAPIQGAIALSAGLIVLLDRKRSRLPGPALRVLIDAALFLCGLMGLFIRA